MILEEMRMMIANCFCSLSFHLLTSAAITKPLHLPVSQTISIVQPMDFPDSLSPSNPPIQSVNVSLKNGIEIECDATRFGVNPNLADCMTANMLTPSSDIDHIWVQRHSGGPDIRYPLPFRIMGGTSRRCTPTVFPVNIILRQGVMLSRTKA